MSAASAEPLRQPVEERRLSGVRVADEGDGEDGVARLALRLARPLDFLQLFLQPGDAVADDAAIELELRLADASGSDAAGLPLEVRPRARQARQHVLELRQLHLRARFAAARAAGEDVENQSAPVDDLDLGDLLEVARLRGREVVVEDDELRAAGLNERFDLLGLAAADVRGRIGPRPFGENAVDNGAAGGLDQFFQLGEMLFCDAAGQVRKNQSDCDYVFGHVALRVE